MKPPDSHRSLLDKVTDYLPAVFVLDGISDRLSRSKQCALRGKFWRSINPHSEETGGIVIAAKKKEAARSLGQLIDRLRSRYSFGYVSSNQK
jgi:hypothetical protein